MKLQTLVFIVRDGQMLLGHKKRGFGAGRWNGYGGKLEGTETIRTCAKRELHEESHLDADEEDLVHLGHVEFGYGGSPARRVHIYYCDIFSGVLKETDEMRPKWFDVKRLPYDDMHEDARFWMPLVVSRKKFVGRFMLDKDEGVKSIRIDIE